MFAFCSCCALQAVNPQQFIECYIAEQNLVGVAIGCASRNRAVAFASTFACFLSRAYDQLRMGAISQTNANFCGSHCGVSIGEHPSSVYVCYRMVQRTGPLRHLDQFVVFAGFAIVTNRHTCTDHGTLTLAVGCILIMVLDAA